MKGYDANQSLIWAGGILGLIPFLASLFGVHWLGWDIERFTLYSGLILAFLCGVVWKNALRFEAQSLMGLTLALVLPAALWLALFTRPEVQIGMAAAGFLVVYGWERHSVWQTYPAGYRVLRTTLTTLVVLIHLLLLALLS